MLIQINSSSCLLRRRLWRL